MIDKVWKYERFNLIETSEAKQQREPREVIGKNEIRFLWPCVLGIQQDRYVLFLSAD